MNVKKLTQRARDNGNNWPIGDSSLPESLFPDEHLRAAIFDYLPVALRCSTATIRQGVKVHLKRTVPSEVRLAPADIQSRDRLMSSLLGNRSVARDRVPEIKFIVSESYKQRGRSGVRERTLTPLSSFADLLWAAYTKAPDMEGIFDWIVNICPPAEAGDTKIFLKPEILDRALSDGSCPVDINNPWLARTIVLFASLLPSLERYELLETARKFGCSPINDAYFSEARMAPSEGGFLEAECDATISLHNLCPRLKQGSIFESRPRRQSAHISEEVERLKFAAEGMRESRLNAEHALRIDVASAIDGPVDAWDAVTEAVARARTAAAEYATLRAASLNQAVNLLKDLEEKFGLPISTNFIEENASIEKISGALIEISSLSDALETLDIPEDVISLWRKNLDWIGSVEDLWKLVDLAERAAIEEKASIEFREEVKAYCADATTAEITNFLESLDSAELAALLPSLTARPWIVACAILFREMLDKGGSDRLKSIQWLISMPNSLRRPILRFVDPTSSLFDGESAFRRMIAVERLRDALSIGPLAQISDPASGLSDIELVGRSVSEFVELVVGHLHVLGSGNDVTRALRVPVSKDGAAEHLVSFINIKATLKGNFHRLREIARELLLVPLLSDGNIDPVKALNLASAIASGQSIEDVIARFEKDRPDERLEARHREQLNRYLQQAEVLLLDFLAETNQKPNSHLVSFMAALRKIRKRLRTTGNVGTVEWLECEVARMLDGESAADDQMTLVGDVTPVSQRIWDSADRDWALSFIDLPEFYSNLLLTPLEVAASVLHWHASGSPPTASAVVSSLIERQLFREALLVASDAGDEPERSRVLSAASPALSALQERANMIAASHRSGQLRSQIDLLEFEAALAKLDVETAEEILDLWQLSLEEEEASLLLSDVPDAVLSERYEKLFEYIHFAGLNSIDDRTSIAELEAIWSDVLAKRTSERSHLIVFLSELERHAAFQPDFAAKLVEFAEAAEDPRCWLREAVCVNFATLIREITPKLVNWIVNYPSFRNEERHALNVLVDWCCNFIIERSRSLHDQDDNELVQSGIDRVLEVAVIVADAQKPTDCLNQLVESGESGSLLLPVSDVDAHGTAGEQYTVLEDKSSYQSPQTNLPALDRSQLPDALSDALRMSKWRVAIEICESDADGASAAAADRLHSLARVIAPLMDQQRLPSTESADTFPASAVWLFGQSDGAPEINESVKIELAFRLLSGAVAADSGQEMNRTPDLGGSWAELLSRASPFRRMLSAGLPSRTGRVLEALITGSMGLAVVERLWDAATNTSDPQAYRTPLLNVLNDHGAHELIVKLAQRYEPAIAPKLAQLFELRAVAQNRPDLLPVAHSLAQDVAGHARGAPFRIYVKGLPSAAQVVKPKLAISVEGSVQLRSTHSGTNHCKIPIIVTPEGLVPSKLFARLFSEDDLTFADGSRFKELSREPMYFATDLTLEINFGGSWFEADAVHRDSVRVRIEAKTVTDELVQEDAICLVRPVDRMKSSGHRLDTETLLELYPGVANNPVVNESFVGRIDELERLHQVLVASRNPSPVLLTGMRRVGKTSLLYAFHQRCSLNRNAGAVSIYQSLAERKVELASPDHTVASVFFRAIAHGLVRPHLPFEDRNHALCSLIREHFGNDWRAARRAIQDCYDEESLSSSLLILAERLREWTGTTLRFIFLIDEAEALVAPYQAGGRKKIELEQFLQSLREVSQTTGSIGLLLSGSNHINVFAREYKNAFFGSSQSIELQGFDDVATASKIIKPRGVERFVQFEEAAVEFAWSLCAGMPQFLWQLGATTAFQVRSGVATRSDIRAAVAMLIGADRVKLPYRPYEILEPIDNMLSLEAARERDLLWMLLYRVAQASSLAAQDAAIPFVIDQSLLGLDDRASWKRRLSALVDLKVLSMESGSAVRFQVPLFAEGFRAPKNWQEFNIRQQQVGI